MSADEIVHQLLSPYSSIGPQIVQLLGREIVKGDTFDRKAIAKKVFNQKELLTALELLLHPAVLEEIEIHYEQIKNQSKYPLFIAEIPLLYEIESAHLFDTVIAVVANRETAKKRFLACTDHPEEEFEKRMTHQMPLTQKSAQADFTLTNDGTLAELEHQVDTLFQQLT
ncbi:MAG: Dephospho-CoA kinase [Chlamydiae bacterium]|nr:Dephospho-CoA kinase [Chlamydiota bacterium]